MKLAMIVVLGVGCVACQGPGFLEQRTGADRAEYGDKAIPVAPPPPHVEIVNPDPVRAGAPAMPGEVVVVGTWTFTTPPTVTRVHRQTVTTDQYSLYNGRPGAGDLPFLVITVSRDRAGVAAGEPGVYRIANQRDFNLNGQVAHEWTGNTNTGAGFCELIVSRGGDAGGDVCHAMGIARTGEEQQLLTEILASIVWKAAG